MKYALNRSSHTAEGFYSVVQQNSAKEGRERGAMSQSDILGFQSRKQEEIKGMVDPIQRHQQVQLDSEVDSLARFALDNV